MSITSPRRTCPDCQGPKHEGELCPRCKRVRNGGTVLAPVEDYQPIDWDARCDREEQFWNPVCYAFIAFAVASIIYWLWSSDFPVRAFVRGLITP